MRLTITAGAADNDSVDVAPALPWVAEAEFGHGLRAALRVVRDAEEPPPFSEPVSPELALVCPELREQALAALPDRDPDGFLPAPRWTLPVADVSDVGDFTELPPQASSRRALAVVAAAYLAVEATQVAVAGAVVMGGLGGVISLATYLHGG